MKTLIWLVALGIGAGLAYWLWLSLRRVAERRQAAEQREASFLAQAMAAGAGPKPAVQAPQRAASASAPQERLLLEAAAKAADAGEPALSIQLYARLLARFPASAFASQARAAVDAQKKKLSTPTAPGPAAPG